jgi:DNA-binding IscR family transcriptional regulator
LARPAGRITLAEVIESVEGELLPSPADERTELRVRPPSWQALDAVWDEMRTKIRCVTGEYTLKDVAERINEREAEMYYI